MRKVLIAEDEVLVRIGLKSTIDWESNGFAIVGEARNGKEGLELFNKYDPDILLTDIRMPVMDGLELIQQARTKKPDLKAVILTHYDDFNYAKEAIKLGASEYLLKSDLTPENLLSVMERVSKNINTKTEDSHSYPKAIKQLLVAELALNPNFNIKNLNEAYDFSKLTCYNTNVYSAMCISLSTVKEDDINVAVTADLFKSVELVAEAISTDKTITYSACYNNNEIYFLINLDGEAHSKSIIVRMVEIADKLKNNFKQFIDAKTIIGISNYSSNLSDLHYLLKRSKNIKKFSFFEETDIVTFENAHSIKEINIPDLNIDILSKYVKTFETALLKDYIDSFFDLLLKKKDIDIVKKVFIDFLSIGKIIAKDLNLQTHPAFGANKFDYDNFNKLNNFSNVRNYVQDIFKELSYRNKDGKSTKYSYVVSKSIDYIKKNYNKNITLSEAADYVDISKSYLSLIFKQETGINLINFINDYRIEKAKEMLTNSNLKIYEIAERIGFDNPYYFSKVFKEATGNSCKEFKNAHFKIE